MNRLSWVILWVAVLLPAGGCTSLVWYGHSPDRQRRIRVIEKPDGQHVRLDGRDHRRYQAIGLSGLTFSPNSRRLAYPARCGCSHHWFVVLDARRGPCFDGVGEVRFSPDSRHLAYVAKRKGKWHVVRDGRTGPAVDAVFKSTLRWSPDSRRLFYVAQRGKKKQVVADGQFGPVFLRVARLTLNAKGRATYIGQRKSGTHAVVGRTVGPAFEGITELVFRPGSPRAVAYVARRRGRWAAVVDGRPGRWYRGVAGLTFSGDGAHVAYAAQVGARARVVLDGREQPLQDGIRYQTLRFTAAGALLYVGRQAGKYRVWWQGQAGPAYDAVQAPVVRGVRWGYVGRRGRVHVVVMNGKVRHTLRSSREVADLTLDPTGRRYAFVAHHKSRATVVVDSLRTDFQLVVGGTFVFGPKGHHWAALVGDRSTKKLYVTIDGRHRRPFDTKELTAEVMRRGPQDSQQIRRWVAAELALHLRRR